MNEEQKDYMKFLCWVNNCLFPADFRDDLIKLGMDKPMAVFFYSEFKSYPEKLEIMRLYQNYCQRDDLKEDDFGYYIQKYINMRHEDWKKLN